MDPSESAELQALRLHLEDPDGQASNLPKNPWHEHHPHPAIDNGRVFVYNCTFRKQNRSVPLDRWPYLRRLAEADIPNDPNEAGEDTVIELDYNQMFGRGSPRDNGDPPGFPGDIFIDLDKAPRAMWICMGDFWEETVANQTDTAEDMVPLPKHPLLWGTYLNSDENNGFGWRSQHFVEEKGIAIPNPRATATARREPKFLCNLRDIIETGCQWPPCRSASVLIKPVNRAVVDAPPLQPPLPLPLPQSQQNPVVTVPRDFLPRPPARVSPARETSQPGQNSIHTFEILKTHGTKRKSVESNQDEPRKVPRRTSQSVSSSRPIFESAPPGDEESRMPSDGVIPLHEKIGMMRARTDASASALNPVDARSESMEYQEVAELLDSDPEPSRRIQDMNIPDFGINGRADPNPFKQIEEIASADGLMSAHHADLLMKALAEIRSTFSAEQCRRSEAEQSLMRAQLRLVASAPPVPERAASGSVEPASEDVAVLKAQLTKLTKSRNNAKQQAEKFLNQVKDAQSKAHEYQEKKADAFRNAQRYQEERTAAQKEAQGFKKALVDAQKELMELKAQNDQLYVQLSHEKRQAVQKETQASKKALIEAQKQLAELKAQNDQLQVQLSAASAPTNPTTSSPPRDPTEVALQFLPHYYTILSRTPKKMHQLYKADSVMSCGRSGENLQPAQGGAEIQKLTNTHLGFFKGSDPQYYSVDSQGSADGSIFVQVLGTTANQGGTKRWKFSQSFLLCRQEDGYYVRNDVMRYGEEGSVKVEE